MGRFTNCLLPRPLRNRRFSDFRDCDAILSSTVCYTVPVTRKA
jgi:hypothetical protein